ncbi:hypothetical protein IMY05_002G0004400 [Salix suchowensis]|nr:hypothetical protein IMY05_002G0004400 [Salix suchowensis]
MAMAGWPGFFGGKVRTTFLQLVCGHSARYPLHWILRLCILLFLGSKYYNGYYLIVGLWPSLPPLGWAFFLMMDNTIFLFLFLFLF